MEIKPIGFIKTDFSDKFGIPRQSGRVPSLRGRVVLCDEYKSAEALRGIEEFSHIWLIFGFSKAKRKGNPLTVRPPRLGGNKRVGVFASRSPYRPNSLGLSVVQLERIEENFDLIVSGVDLMNDTPIYDIKPYLPYADSHPMAKGGYGEAMKNHKLSVDFPQNLLEMIPKDKQKAVVECLEDDPRPSYHKECRKYSMRFSDFDIHFEVFGENLSVVDVERI